MTAANGNAANPSSSHSLASSPPTTFRLQGWDPLLLATQIVTLQSLHYLTLACCTVLVLSLCRALNLVSAFDLDREGGALNVAMVMDWRLAMGRSTVPPEVDSWSSLHDAANGYAGLGGGSRGRALCLAWILTSAVE